MTVGYDKFVGINEYTGEFITPAVKYHSFYLPKFPSVALSSIVVALATTHSSILQMKTYYAIFNCQSNNHKIKNIFFISFTLVRISFYHIHFLFTTRKNIAVAYKKYFNYKSHLFFHIFKYYSMLSKITKKPILYCYKTWLYKIPYIIYI